MSLYLDAFWLFLEFSVIFWSVGLFGLWLCIGNNIPDERGYARPADD